MGAGHAVPLLDLEIGDILRGAVFGRLEGERLARPAAIGDVELQPLAIAQDAGDGAIRHSNGLGDRRARRQQGSNKGPPEHAGRYHGPRWLQ